MIAQKFNVQFEDFILLRSSMNFIDVEAGSKEEFDAAENFSTYEIDFNFGFKRDKESIYVFTKVSINGGDSPVVGYQLFCEGVGILNVDQIDLDDPAKWSHNAVAYCVSQLRAHLQLLTFNGSYGRYTLPLLDLDALIKEKNEAAKSKAVATSPSSRKKSSPAKKKKA
jgi:hypothetical protein